MASSWAGSLQQPHRINAWGVCGTVNGCGSHLSLTKQCVSHKAMCCLTRRAYSGLLHRYVQPACGGWQFNFNRIVDDLADVFQLALCYFGVQVSLGTIGTDQFTRPTAREHNWKVLGAAPGILAKRRVTTTIFTTCLCAFKPCDLCLISHPHA